MAAFRCGDVTAQFLGVVVQAEVGQELLAGVVPDRRELRRDGLDPRGVVVAGIGRRRVLGSRSQQDVAGGQAGPLCAAPAS